jgi:hypothetical protein
MKKKMKLGIQFKKYNKSNQENLSLIAMLISFQEYSMGVALTLILLKHRVLQIKHIEQNSKMK